ncbi:AAA family ATPase [Bacillus thuringiensis]|uniref:AAA family ATPase n=1 Tax=Bacillus thuringiensis TaxID=1428 RepID=A0A9X7GK41_BACTU|nr:AAA family ATPase [Bacillus thuringiensis]PGH85834.1 AAA family ATPase [Bacillus thuringiensis]
MQKVAKSLDLKVNFHSDKCMKHSYEAGGQTIIKPIQMIEFKGQVVCPRCVVEENDRVLKEQANNHYKKIQRTKKFNMLTKHSIIRNEEIIESTLANYKTACKETKANKKLVEEIVESLKVGEVKNVFIVGVQGAGKSHLAYSVLKELRDYFYEISNGEADNDELIYQKMKSCLYVEIEQIMRLIKDSFNNKDSMYTEEYCVDLLTSVDFLVLDDLGAESGSMNRTDEASNFIQRVLYAVTNGRQGKVTITTTNLSSGDIFKKYDKKLGSRILNKAQAVVFKETSDKRIEHLGF